MAGQDWMMNGKRCQGSRRTILLHDTEWVSGTGTSTIDIPCPECGKVVKAKIVSAKIITKEIWVNIPIHKKPGLPKGVRIIDGKRYISFSMLVSHVKKLGWTAPNIQPCHDLRSCNGGASWYVEAWRTPQENSDQNYISGQLNNVGHVPTEGARYVRQKAKQQAWIWLGEKIGLLTYVELFTHKKTSGSVADEIIF